MNDHNKPGARHVGDLYGNQVYVIEGARLDPREGETMMYAMQRTRSELWADGRAPAIYLTERQWRDLQTEIVEARAVLGLRVVTGGEW